MTCASPLPFSVRLRCSLPAVRLRLLFLDTATGEILRDIRGGHLLQVIHEGGILLAGALKHATGG